MLFKAATSKTTTTFLTGYAGNIVCARFLTLLAYALNYWLKLLAHILRNTTEQ